MHQALHLLAGLLEDENADTVREGSIISSCALSEDEFENIASEGGTEAGDSDVFCAESYATADVLPVLLCRLAYTMFV